MGGLGLLNEHVEKLGHFFAIFEHFYWIFEDFEGFLRIFEVIWGLFDGHLAD